MDRTHNTAQPDPAAARYEDDKVLAGFTGAGLADTLAEKVEDVLRQYPGSDVEREAIARLVIHRLRFPRS